MTSFLNRLSGRKVTFDSKSKSAFEGNLEKREATAVNSTSPSTARWQSRYFRLYEDVLCWFKKDTEVAPAAMIPLVSMIYVSPVKKEDVRRFDIVVKSDTDTWTLPFRAATEENADKWVEALKAEVTKAQAAEKKCKSPLKFDLKGKFWKDVVHISLTRERRKEAEERSTGSKDAKQRTKAVRSGVLKKKSPKLGIWQTREVELYPDVLLYREKGKLNSSGAIPLWNVFEVKLGSGNSFLINCRQNESETRVFTFYAETEDLAIDWVNDILDCHKEHGPETAEDKFHRLVVRGDEATAEGDHDMAVDYYRQALDIQPQHKEVLEKLRVARATNKKKFQESQNPEVKQLKLEGNDYFAEKQYDKAKECYDKAIELDPTNSLLYFNRAAAWHFLKNPDQAEADSRKAVELDPESVDARTRLALSLVKAKKYAEARKAYEEALKLDSLDVRAYKGLQAIDKAEKADSAPPASPTPATASMIARGEESSDGSVPSTPASPTSIRHLEFDVAAEPRDTLGESSSPRPSYLSLDDSSSSSSPLPPSSSSSSSSSEPESASTPTSSQTTSEPSPGSASPEGGSASAPSASGEKSSSSEEKSSSSLPEEKSLSSPSAPPSVEASTPAPTEASTPAPAPAETSTPAPAEASTPAPEASAPPTAPTEASAAPPSDEGQAAPLSPGEGGGSGTEAPVAPE